ncbi:hypothetical protein Zmor_023076 [Zophobas morio]|uniref:Peptidase S1 domain-containing protein n=1 Tax=Zophobas morio TaxID=2755281 RepID=A0AA38HZY8_9CUCU|nr:hypothetical protein Zmor_023076 [Zophobas morio]
MFLYHSRLPTYLLYVILITRFISVDNFHNLVKECTLEEYDSAVTLRTARLSQFCAGALIQTRWVVTASHCVYMVRPPSAIRVMKKGTQSKSRTTIIKASKIYLQETYDPKTLENDVSLLFLERSFPQNINFAVLPSTDLFLHLAHHNDDVGVVVTWSENRPWVQSKVMEPICISVHIWNETSCEIHYKYIFQDLTMFCTGSGPHGNHPCRGDSGGPLYVDNVLVGVVSFGVDCKLKNASSMFGRVDSALGFIEKAVASHEQKFMKKNFEGFDVYYVGVGQDSGVGAKRYMFVIPVTLGCCVWLSNFGILI